MKNFNLYQNRLRDSRKISKDNLIDIKTKTFKRALESSYNSEIVVFNNKEIQALVTGIPTTPSIGKRNFATLLDHDCGVGDEVYWPANDSYWLITYHDDTEGAIFQGAMEKALYNIKWQDKDTGKKYSARACAKGPDETTVSDGVKHSIFFDRLTDSLFLIVSAKAEGSHLLERYFEIMVEGRKWRIEVVDNFTNNKLIVMQLMEALFDRDSDTEDIVGGKLPNVFEVNSSLKGVEQLKLGTSIDFKPRLLRNGSLVNTEVEKIDVSNCTLEEDSLTFNELGLSSIQVKFKGYKEIFEFKVEIIEPSEDVVENSVSKILGQETIRTLRTGEFVIFHTVDGQERPLTGEWQLDPTQEIVEILEATNNKITLKATNKTGRTVLKYVVDDKVLEKEIVVIPLFGGR